MKEEVENNLQMWLNIFQYPISNWQNTQEENEN